ncbi:hypothetical protein QBC44DRAFT_311155 [Cladorrhinum sp. PSN332]|nr:hypothetical protein QBC44DRAFT_311155 [Cladorrhinum sp. PSN332]
MTEIDRNSPAAGHDGKGCQCYFNSSEIKKGRWQQDKKVCLQNCRTEFLKWVMPGWDDNSRWIEGCGSLLADNTTTPPFKTEDKFWNLYWCDSTFCGVAINPSGGLGQDRPVYSPEFKCYTEADNTDVLCNAYAQNHMPNVPDQTSGSRQTIAVNTLSSETATWTPSTVVSFSTSTTERTEATTTESSTATHPSISATSTTDTDPAPAAAAVNSSSSTTSGSPLSTPSRIAVGVCTALVLVGLICAALLCLRRRNRRRRSSSYQGLHPHPHPHRRYFLLGKRIHGPQGANSSPSSSSSPTRLISSPASSALGNHPISLTYYTNNNHNHNHNSSSSSSNNPQILTPPLRLRDRRFLPSILGSSTSTNGYGKNDGSSPPLTPLTPVYKSPVVGSGSSTTFPASPLCTPTTSKLIPRHERTPRAHTGGLPLIPSSSQSENNSFSLPPKIPAAAASISSSTRTSSLRREFSSGVENPFTSNKNVISWTPPGSPTRPPRPHHDASGMADLLATNTSRQFVGGAGNAGTPPTSPPPNRALPCPPGRHGAYSFVSCASSDYSVHAGDGEGIGVAVSEEKEKEKEKEEHKDTDQNGRDAGSWGSWSGVGTQGRERKEVQAVDGNGVSPRSSGSSGSSGSLTVTAERIGRV